MSARKNNGSLFATFFSIGARPDMSEWEIRRLYLLNSFYLVGKLTLIATIIETYLVEGTPMGNLLLVMSIPIFTGFIMLCLRRVDLAEFLFLFGGNVLLFTMNNIYGHEGGIYLYYFPFFLVVAFIVDTRRIYMSLFHVLLTVTLIIAGLVFDHQLFYRPFKKEILEFSYETSLIVAVIGMTIISLLIVRMSYQQQERYAIRMAEKQKATDEMQLAVKEKETLLAEVHHRVKNNLAVITSLLNLQMHSVKDEYTRQVLQEIRNRIGSMSLIHQKLYQRQNVETIDFGNYAESLADDIQNSYSSQLHTAISVAIDAEHIHLPLTTAVPCGLILNETLSNCYKHAFKGRKKGEVIIRFRRDKDDPDLLILEINDDGVGLPPELNIQQASSLGLTIISSLAEQLDATWKLDSGPGGSHFSMKFRCHT